MSEVELYLGDCLEILPTLAGPVDAIITDLPYGTTACSWDVVIPFTPMWEQVKRLLKPNGAFVTTASQPFTSMLVMSNLKQFHQELIWVKQQPKGFLDARRKHLDDYESVLIFCSGLPTYNPQNTRPMNVKNGRRNKGGNGVYGKVGNPGYVQTVGNFPRSVLYFDAVTQDSIHPTQKSLALYEYLVLTYTNPGDTVLDFCFGSGTTGVACVKLGRHFIGCEIRPDYYVLAERRIHDAQLQIPMALVCQ